MVPYSVFDLFFRGTHGFAGNCWTSFFVHLVATNENGITGTRRLGDQCQWQIKALTTAFGDGTRAPSFWWARRQSRRAVEPWNCAAEADGHLLLRIAYYASHTTCMHTKLGLGYPYDIGLLRVVDDHH